MLELVGSPYKSRGQTPEEGFDCYTFCQYVLKNELSIELPDWPPQSPGWARYVRVFRPPPAKYEKYDLLMFGDIIPELANHIGIMASATDMVHCASRYGGVVCQPAEQFSNLIIALGRPKP